MKIAYYVTRTRPGRPTYGYWTPCLARRNPKTGNIEPTLMAKLGFTVVDCGVDGPMAWALANSMNEKWRRARDAHLSGLPVAAMPRVYLPGSLGEAFDRFKATNEWQGKKPRTREDWERGWKLIDPVFGDIAPSEVAFEDLDLWYAGDPNNPDIQGLLQRVGVREAARGVKIWRALWNVIATMKRADGKPYCEGKDPSLGIRVKTPKPRNAYWREGEAVRLVKGAWRMDFHGLAAALAVAWDTMLSPVDVRGLTPAQLHGDVDGSLFELARAKTGRAAIGTLSRRARFVLDAYIAGLGFKLHQDAPIFRTPGAAPGPRGGRRWLPRPYTKDTLGRDFRIVREAAFPGDKRVLSDFRRSGAIEVAAGEADPSALAAKMANSIDSNRALQATYTPHNATLVRLADKARAVGRNRLRNGPGSKT